jgi:hypothetical protein
MIAITTPRRELGSRCEARNSEVKRALQLGADFIFMMDDDQTIPESGINEMLLTLNDGYDVAVIDAPSKETGAPNVFYHPNGELAWTGFSCAMFRKEVFEKIESPWFEDWYTYDVKTEKGKYVFTKVEKYKPDNVGEDANFYFKCLENDIKIKIIEGIKCDHINLLQNNQGAK